GKRRTGTRTLLDLIDDGFALPFVFVLRDQAHLVEPLKDLELFLDFALLVGEGGIRRGRGIAALRSLRRRSSLLLLVVLSPRPELGKETLLFDRLFREFAGANGFEHRVAVGERIAGGRPPMAMVRAGSMVGMAAVGIQRSAGMSEGRAGTEDETSERGREEHSMKRVSAHDRRF